MNTSQSSLRSFLQETFYVRDAEGARLGRLARRRGHRRLDRLPRAHRVPRGRVRLHGPGRGGNSPREPRHARAHRRLRRTQARGRHCGVSEGAVLRVMQKLRTHLFNRHEPAVEVLERALRAARGLANARLRLRALDVVGPGARCFGRLRVENAGAIEAGARLALESRYGAVSLVTAPRGGESAAGLGRRRAVWSSASLSPGRQSGPSTRWSSGAASSSASSASSRTRTSHSGSGAPIVIEDDVWLAARVVVRPRRAHRRGRGGGRGQRRRGRAAPGRHRERPARVLRVRDRDRAAPMSAPPPVSAPRVVA